MAERSEQRSNRASTGIGPIGRLQAWGADHARAAVGALGRLARTRLASGMTAGVLGIALALPAAFLLLLDNVERHAGDWDDGAQISLFLQMDIGESAHRELADELAGRHSIERAEVVTPDEALTEFQELSGMDAALAMLDDNPLPPVIVIHPRRGTDATSLETLTNELSDHGAVDRARLDLEWVQRLQAIMELLRRAAWIVAGLLGLAVIMVVGNTIRLAIENRREEIVITKLIGGTNAFIRRPFLYEGAWYGVIGGLLATILVEGGRLMLSGPLHRLAELYQTGPLLSGLGFQGIVAVWAVGIGLGLAGSWIAVGRHLASIEPR
ncbi:permease-like cell division protein FtsX [Aquisalimonas sp.]|uniref:permease-like cell division protein FtsX n=1 Tax=unclassified Aquisalimonas TaxID=2644645 RepID=UPI0025BD5DDB|nr:permease-like cell division protein FtsX [Aquisalimonas sp.]